MRKSLYFLAFMLALVFGFYAWHTPTGGPLTDEEINTFLANQKETGGTAWTDQDAFEAFLRSDDGRPFVMINLMELRDDAIYPEGTISENTTGAEADAAYGRTVVPLLLSRGSYPLIQAERSNTIINSLDQTAGAFDTVAMVRYRSRRDLIDMISSETFSDAEIHKWASLENTVVAPASKMAAFQFIGYLPAFAFVLVAAVLGTAAVAHKSERRKMDAN